MNNLSKDKRKIANKLRVKQGKEPLNLIRSCVSNKKAINIDLLSISLEDAFYKPCIYYLTANDKIVYVGETESLMTRMYQHLKDNKKVFDGFSFFYFEGTRRERLLKEKLEIKRLNPYYNITHNKWQHEPSEKAKQVFKKNTSHKRMNNLLDKIAKNLKDK